MENRGGGFSRLTAGRKKCGDKSAKTQVRLELILPFNIRHNAVFNRENEFFRTDKPACIGFYRTDDDFSAVELSYAVGSHNPDGAILSSAKLPKKSQSSANESVSASSRDSRASASSSLPSRTACINASAVSCGEFGICARFVKKPVSGGNSRSEPPKNSYLVRFSCPKTVPSGSIAVR